MVTLVKGKRSNNMHTFPNLLILRLLEVSDKEPEEAVLKSMFICSLVYLIMYPQLHRLQHSTKKDCQEY